MDTWCSTIVNKNELCWSVQFPTICNTKKGGEEKKLVEVMEISSEPVCLIVCEELPCYGILTVVETQGILFSCCICGIWRFGAVQIIGSLINCNYWTK